MARFFITGPNDQVQIYQISSSTVSIGRAPRNDVVLDDPSVSRRHARLTVLADGTTLLTDLGSQNGTFVNDQQIHNHQLCDRDTVNLGRFQLRYEVADEPPPHVIITGSRAAAQITGLISSETLLIIPPTEAGGTRPGQGVQDQLLLEKDNKLLRLLLRVGSMLSSVLTQEEIMHQVMELVFQIENVERGFVMLQDEKKAFKPAVLLYKDQRLKAEAHDVVLSKALIERVTTERLPLLIHDLAGDERFSASATARLSPTRSAMCAPLVYKDNLFGIFYADCLSKASAFTKEELEIFSVIAAQAAISFDCARTHEELSRRALERQALERFMSSAIVEKILAKPDQIRLGGENQTVAILFADIRGFTAMSERMEPQKVVELLNEFFSEMTNLVFEHGGTLDKYLGDGIMAIFGAPIPKPDDAVRSVKTAIDMQQALVRLNSRWEARGQRPLEIGIGVHSGPVTAGIIGSPNRMDYTVIGQPVNLASRLCAHAAGGQILVSQSVFQQLQGSAPAKVLDPIRVKGQEAPVEICEVLWRDWNSSRPAKL